MVRDQIVMAAAAAMGLLAFPAPAGAQTSMTLADVLARAREVAPQIVSARLAVDEARARVLGAGLRSQNNPEVEAILGTRSGEIDRSTDLDLSLSQMFEPPGRRAARRAAAAAAVARGEALVAATTRDVLLEAAGAFYRAVHATERIALFANAETIATGIFQAADRRYKAGDIAVLEANLTKIALARVRSERDSAAADRVAAMGTLRQILRLDGELTLRASLTAGPAPDRAALVAVALERPEVRELQAAIRETEADVRFARSFSRPDVGFAITYQQEEGDRVIGGGIRLSLPLFARGQEQLAAGSARALRLRHELESTTARIRVEVESAADALDRRLAAVRILETEALAGLEENETLAARSFEVGQIGLPDFLLFRRELLETRFRYLDTLLEASIARIELDAAAGVLR